MSTGHAMPVEDEAAAVSLPGLSRRCKEWLERKALDVKQVRKLPRASMTLVVTELIEDAMQREKNGVDR